MSRRTQPRTPTPTAPESRLERGHPRAASFAFVFRLIRASLASVLWLLLGACALGGAQIQPMYVKPERPGPGEIVLPSRSLLAFDASGSIDRKVLFPTERSRVRAFVDSMPPGTYQSSLVVIGGRPGEGIDFERFDRFRLELAVQRTNWRGEATPITQLLDDLAETLRGIDEKTVLVLWTDGVPTRYGKYIGPEEALDATDRLLAAHPGKLCIHTIQVGHDERGPSLLEPMATRSGCGSSHQMDDLDTPERMAALQRTIYIGPAPPPPPPKQRHITDLDHDGVDDRFDRCARTPIGAHVDERGCWVIEDTVFDLGSDRIRSDRSAPLEAVLAVLHGNERLRISIDGHTDDVGPSDFNLALSQQRADSVRNWLVQHGIAEDRLRTRAFGPIRPAAGNDTSEGRQKNRRVEISVLDD